MNFDDENQKHIFLLGLFVLCVWMLVIILCASPQLFRDFLQKHICCCFLAQRNKRLEKLKEAQERLRNANLSFLNNSLTDNPSSILLQQAVGPNHLKHALIKIAEPIFEESGSNNIPLTNAEDDPNISIQIYDATTRKF